MMPVSTEKAALQVGGNIGDKSELDKQPAVNSNYLFAAAVLMIIGTVGFLVVFVESIFALQGVSMWYPQFVAQQWFIYDELFTIFTFLGLLLGSLMASLMFSHTKAALISGILCTTLGASVSVTSLIAPLAVLWKSVLYYFLPLFFTPLIGTLLFYYATLFAR